MITLTPLLLTAELFSPFGEVIEEPMSDIADKPDRRFNDLAYLDAGADGSLMLSILRMRTTIQLPFHFSKLERHPLGSQAFVPCAPARFLIVTALGDDSPQMQNLVAFVTNGRQGINYRKGIWHAPLATFDAANFLVLDRNGPGNNCDIFMDFHISIAMQEQ